MRITIETKEGIKLTYNQIESGNIELTPKITHYRCDGTKMSEEIGDTLNNEIIKSITIEY